MYLNTKKELEKGLQYLNSKTDTLSDDLRSDLQKEILRLEGGDFKGS